MQRKFMQFQAVNKISQSYFQKTLPPSSFFNLSTYFALKTAFPSKLTGEMGKEVVWSFRLAFGWLLWGCGNNFLCVYCVSVYMTVYGCCVSFSILSLEKEFRVNTFFKYEIALIFKNQGSVCIKVVLLKINFLYLFSGRNINESYNT